MHVVANRLHLLRAAPCPVEQGPGHVGEPIGFAVPAAEQKQQALVGKILYGVVPMKREVSYESPWFAIAVADNRVRPAGATIREHQLPNASR